MKAFSNILSYISDTINRIVELISVSLLLILSTLMVVAVFYRYVLNNSIYWSSEVSTILLVFISFLGSSVAYKYKAHIGVDILTDKLSKRSKKILGFIINLSFCLFWLLVFVESFKLIPIFLIQTTATLEIPYAYIFSIVPLTSLIWIIHTVSELIKTISGDK